VAHLSNRDFDDPIEEEPEPKQRARLVIVGIVLAVLGVASAFGWRAYGGSPYAPEMVGLDEFHAFQHQVAGQLQSSAQALAAQQAEVKRLSDQMAAVSTKMDTLASAISSARAAMPAAPPPHPQKRASPKPSARISTGGAPLPPPIQLTH
jgi:uncharacterized coiled-coil protein SlyX